MEKVFEEREMIERYNFSRMLLHYFKPCSPPSSELSGFSARELLHLYQVHNPQSQLTSGIVHNILLMGGYVRMETGKELELFAEINESNFLEANRTVQMAILKHTVGPAEVKYRQIVLGIKIRKIHEDGTYEIVDNPINSVTTFVSRWTINRNDRYHHYMRPIHRSTILEVYNFYRVICATYGMDIVDRKTFNKTLEEMGYTILTGAVHKKAGFKYFKSLYIPQSIDDIKLSLDINAAAIFNGRTHWTKDYQLVENYTEALLEHLRSENLRRMKVDGEQKRTPTPKELESNKTYARGAAEVFQTPFIPEKATVEEGEALAKRLDEIVASEDQAAEAQVSEPERTSVENVKRDAAIEPSDERDTVDSDPQYIIDNEPPVVSTPSKPEQSLSDVVRRVEEPRSEVSERIHSGNEYRRIVRSSAAKRDIMEFESGSAITADEESAVSGELGGSVEASFEEIAEAMKIPYQLTPKGSFTLDVFAEWLNKMGIECSDVRAYYKHVMPMIQA